MEAVYRLLRSEFFQEHLAEFWLATWLGLFMPLLIATLVAYRRSPGPRPLHSFSSIDRRLAFLALPIGVYAFFIVYKQDFAAYDNDILTDYVLRGKFYAPPVWPLQGRFFPLGHQEWNLLRLATTTPIWYFLLPVVQLLIAVGLLFLVLRPLPRWVFPVATLVLITTPGFVHAYFSLTVPERNLVLWLLVFILSLESYVRAPSRLSLGILLLSTHVTLYYKEPAFLIVGGVAGLRLLDGLWSQRASGRGVRMIVASHRAEVGLLALCAVYLALYAAVYLPYRSLGYAESRATSSLEALVYYLTSNVLLSAFLASSIGRIGFLLLSGRRLDRVWDYLAIGALGYAAFYVAIGLTGEYYMAPVNVVAMLYLLRVCARLRALQWRTAAFASLLLLVAAQNLFLTPRIVLHRLNFIDGRAQIVAYLTEYAGTRNGEPVRLHLPFAQQPFVIYYFSCFLHHKVREATPAARPSDHPAFALTSPLNFPRNHCVPWNADHLCAHEDGPLPGDLIVVLPENGISQEMVAKLKASAELLFHYSPVPASSPMHGYVFRRTA